MKNKKSWPVEIDENFIGAVAETIDAKTEFWLVPSVAKKMRKTGWSFYLYFFKDIFLHKQNLLFLSFLKNSSSSSLSLLTLTKRCLLLLKWYCVNFSRFLFEFGFQNWERQRECRTVRQRNHMMNWVEFQRWRSLWSVLPLWHFWSISSPDSSSREEESSFWIRKRRYVFFFF